MVLVALLMVTMLAGCGKKKEEPVVEEDEYSYDTEVEEVEEVVEETEEVVEEVAEEAAEDVEEVTESSLE